MGILNKTILALGAVALSCSAAAQTHYNSNVSVGAKGGADMSQVMFHPSVSQKLRPGALFGFTFRYIEENHFGIIAELNYVQRGWKEDFDVRSYSYSRRLDYMEIPVMTHIYFGRRGKFFVNAGPQIGYLLGSIIKSNFNPSEWRFIPELSARGRNGEQFDMKISNRFDYGISAGLGGEFNINPKNSISMEARFYYGLGNMMPSRRADYFSASNSMTVSLALGYWFRIK